MNGLELIGKRFNRPIARWGFEDIVVDATPEWVQPTQRDVAVQLGISLKAVWETEQRALRKLRAVMSYEEWREVLEVE